MKHILTLGNFGGGEVVLILIFLASITTFIWINKRKKKKIKELEIRKKRLIQEATYLFNSGVLTKAEFMYEREKIQNEQI